MRAEGPVVGEFWDGPVLLGKRRRVFLIQRAVLALSIAVSVAGVLFGVNFLVNLERLALENAKDRLATHAEAHAEAVDRVQDGEQKILARVVRSIIAETSPLEDRVRRMENLDRLFQMTRAWKAVAAQQAADQREEKIDALTFFVSPTDGKMTPINPTVGGGLDMSRLSKAGSPKDLDIIMALVRQRAEGDVRHDQRAFVLEDLAKKLQPQQEAPL